MPGTFIELDNENSTSVAYQWLQRVESGTTKPFLATWTSNTTKLTNGVAIADAISIGWQPSDLSKFPPAYATDIARKIGVPLITATPATSSSLPRETSTLPVLPPPQNLSTAAKAGIGIGAALGFTVIISIIVAILLLRKRRQKRAAATPSTDARPDTPEMEDQDVTLATRKWYLGGRWRNEAEARNDPEELDSRAVHVVPGPPAELDAAERRRET
ncbi:hypothetical protein CC86DRAFT_435446 [Ophiobolus disseminans]|uniref:Uncharacterized protein n=1 Tax=Ophiobolus disseminans TaxID=1469910 RepID=A0A6A7AA82_9PLEO|nr:hypothetical protein CC86DRAFT_435446 [Ophiobolus disseminans]